MFRHSFDLFNLEDQAELRSLLGVEDLKLKFAPKDSPELNIERGLAIGGMLLTLGAIFLQGMTGLYCLIGVSACMSLMFPTIYGIALRGLGEDAKFGAAGLIMAILGGSVMPPLQGAVIKQGTLFSMPAENVSFFIPLIWPL